MDMLGNRTGVVERIMELGLTPCVVRDVAQVADKEQCPHIDMILVGSLGVVCRFHCRFKHGVVSLQFVLTNRTNKRV